MLFSFCYVALRQVLELLVLCIRSNDCKKLETLVLRHELAMLRRRRSRPVIRADRPAFRERGQHARRVVLHRPNRIPGPFAGPVPGEISFWFGNLGLELGR